MEITISKWKGDGMIRPTLCIEGSFVDDDSNVRVLRASCTFFDETAEWRVYVDGVEDVFVRKTAGEASDCAELLIRERLEGGHGRTRLTNYHHMTADQRAWGELDTLLGDKVIEGTVTSKSLDESRVMVRRDSDGRMFLCHPTENIPADEIVVGDKVRAGFHSGNKNWGIVKIFDDEEEEAPADEPAEKPEVDRPLFVLPRFSGWLEDDDHETELIEVWPMPAGYEASFAGDWSDKYVIKFKGEILDSADELEAAKERALWVSEQLGENNYHTPRQVGTIVDVKGEEARVKFDDEEYTTSFIRLSLAGVRKGKVVAEVGDRVILQHGHDAKWFVATLLTNPELDLHEARVVSFTKGEANVVLTGEPNTRVKGVQVRARIGWSALGIGSVPYINVGDLVAVYSVKQPGDEDVQPGDIWDIHHVIDRVKIEVRNDWGVINRICLTGEYRNVKVHSEIEAKDGDEFMLDDRDETAFRTELNHVEYALRNKAVRLWQMQEMANRRFPNENTGE